MTFEIRGLVPELWCSDFDKSLGFYTEVLGFSVVQRRGNDRHAYLELGSAQLMIANWRQDGTWESAPLEKPYGRGLNFQIIVEDVQRLYEQVLSKGVDPFVKIYSADYWRTNRMDHRKEFGVLDPDGYLLRFSQVVSYRMVEEADLDALDHKNARP